MKVAKLSSRRWTTAADYLLASCGDRFGSKGSAAHLPARYFFHLRDAGRFVPDKEGMLLQGMEEVRREARRGAEWMMTAKAETGLFRPSTSKIEVCDEAGHIVYELRM